MGRTGAPWTQQRLDEARELYDSGLSFAQVGRQLGYSPGYLANQFRRAGVRVRGSGRPLTSAAPPVDLDELVRLREEGATFPALAARFGVSTDMVRTRYLRAKGRPLRRAEAERRGVPFP